MSIEQSLERIATALEALVDCVPLQALQQKHEVAPAEEPTPPPAKKKTTRKTTAAKKNDKKYTEDELRQTFQEYVGRKGNEEGTSALKELIAKVGATKIGDIKPEDYGTIIEEVKSWK